MDSKTLAQSFRSAFAATTKNLEGITELEASQGVEGGANTINWIAGHILMSRGGLAQLLGGTPFLTPDEKKLYERGQAPGDKVVQLTRIIEGLHATAELLPEKVAELTDEKLQETLPANYFPIPVKIATRAALLEILLFHEGYHAGQLGILRRVIGKSGAIA